MILEKTDKFMEKLLADGSAFRIQITPDRNLMFEGNSKLQTSDFVVINGEKVWGRSGLTWLPTSPLPTSPISLCVFALKRAVVFREDGALDCLSPKKAIDSGTSFLLCAKLPNSIRLMIADPAAGKNLIVLKLLRDEDGMAFCNALVRQFAQQRAPDSSDALSCFLDGGDNLGA